MFLNNLMTLTVHFDLESLHTLQKLMFPFFDPLKKFKLPFFLIKF